PLEHRQLRSEYLLVGRLADVAVAVVGPQLQEHVLVGQRHAERRRVDRPGDRLDVPAHGAATAPRGSSRGCARRSAIVYGSCGARNTVSARPVSTIRPWDMIATRSATSASTA